MWRWRKILGVEQFIAGTRDLYRRWLPDKIDDEALAKIKASLRSPERIAKVAAANRGRPMSEKVKRILYRATKRRKASAASRRKMSDAQKRRPLRPSSWLPHEDAALGTARDAEVAARLGRTLSSVRTRRKRLAIPNVVTRQPRSTPPKWTPARDRLLGAMRDPVLAHKLRCTPNIIRNRRYRLAFQRFVPHDRRR